MNLKQAKDLLTKEQKERQRQMSIISFQPHTLFELKKEKNAQLLEFDNSGGEQNSNEMKQLSNEEAQADENNSNNDNGSIDKPGNVDGSINSQESDKKQFQDYKFKIVPPGERPANYDETAE